MVTEYRATAREILKRAYHDKAKAINAKYDPQIDLNDREARDRRRDAIAMFEAFLLKYPNDKRWTPDAMFRLAELYYEKSAEEYLDADEAYKKALDTPNPPDTPPPRVDYTPTINLYRRLLTEFPSYRFLDAAYYLLGFCLGEMGEDQQAQAGAARARLLEPIQAARHAGADAEAVAARAGRAATPPTRTSTRSARRSGRSRSSSPRRGRASASSTSTTRTSCEFAIAAFRKVLTFKDSPYYDRALYKLAWSYYRDNRFPEAVREFDNLVKYADARTAAGQKVGSDLRPEAVQYLGVSFGEPDWDGDTLPDPITGLQRAMEFYKGREKEPHVREVFQRLGDIYFDQTKYQDAIAVYKALLDEVAVLLGRAARAGPHRPRLREGPQPGRGRQGARDAGPLVHQGQRLVPAQQGQPGSARGRAPAGRGRAADRGDQRPRRGAGLQDQVAGEPEGHEEAGGVQEAVRDQRRAVREVPGGVPELEAQLRVRGVLRRRALLLGAAASRRSPPTGTCATRSSTTGTRKTPRSG